MTTIEATTGSTDAATVTLRVGTRKGAWTLAADDSGRDRWMLSEPTMLGHVIQHVMADPREPRAGADRSTHRASRTDRHAVVGRRCLVDRIDPPSGVRSGRCPWPSRARRVLAHTRARRRARHLVRRCVAARPVPLRRSRRNVGARSADGTITRTGRRGRNGPTSRARPTARCSTRSTSIPATRTTCTSACRAVESSSRATAAPTGTRSTPGCAADFLPDPDVPYGHDPHCVRLHPLQPDRLYQQNHCGIYRHRPARHTVGAHRRRHAARGRRHRLPGRTAPARSRHGVGLPDGRHRRVAALEPRRPPRGVRHPRRRRDRGSGRTTGCPSGPGSR